MPYDYVSIFIACGWTLNRLMEAVMKKRTIKKSCRTCMGKVDECPEEQFQLRLKKVKMGVEQRRQALRLQYLLGKNFKRGLDYF
jgi:hypothetical protein